MAQEQRHAGLKSYVVGWSEQQKCFHIETVEEMLLRNRRNFERCSKVDFVPLAFAASFADANEIAEKYRQKRNVPLLQEQLHTAHKSTKSS
jgi:hypothetical protein